MRIRRYYTSKYLRHKWKGFSSDTESILLTIREGKKFVWGLFIYKVLD